MPTCICTSARVVVTGSNAATVIPETWIGVKCEKDQEKDVSFFFLANLPGEIVGDRARRFNKLTVYNLPHAKADNANPS